MIYHNPPKTVLAQAEVVTLLALKVPGWKEVVIGRTAGLKAGAGDLDVINIPVDSTDSKLLQSWRERIHHAKA